MQTFYSPEVINVVGGVTSETARINIEQSAATGRGLARWEGSEDELVATRSTSRTLLIPATNSLLGDLQVGGVH